MSTNIHNIFIGGTYSNEEAECRKIFGLDDGKYSNLQKNKYSDKQFIIHPWDGGNDHGERVEGAKSLRKTLYELANTGSSDKHIFNLIGFSHGGTVAMLALSDKVPMWLMEYRLFTIAMPALTRYQHEAFVTATSFLHLLKWTNIYSTRDRVQGGLAGIRLKDDLLHRGRYYFTNDDIFDSIKACYKNIIIDDESKGGIRIHESLPSNSDVIKLVEEICNDCK